MLIAAVSSARRVYLLSNAATNGGMTGLIGQASDQSDDDEKQVLILILSLSDETSGSFFQILDRYTNLGIYVIHHTYVNVADFGSLLVSFTLAELFTMSGFYLTSATVKSAKTAAEESVNVFDGIVSNAILLRSSPNTAVRLKRDVPSAVVDHHAC